MDDAPVTCGVVLGGAVEGDNPQDAAEKGGSPDTFNRQLLSEIVQLKEHINLVQKSKNVTLFEEVFREIDATLKNFPHPIVIVVEKFDDSSQNWIRVTETVGPMHRTKAKLYVLVATYPAFEAYYRNVHQSYVHIYRLYLQIRNTSIHTIAPLRALLATDTMLTLDQNSCQSSSSDDWQDAVLERKLMMLANGYMISRIKNIVDEARSMVERTSSLSFLRRSNSAWMMQITVKTERQDLIDFY